VAAPLAVCAGLNEPHAPALPQVTVQSTPLLAGSLETVALTVALALVCNVVGGAWVKTITMSGGVMVTTAETVLVGSAVEEAVIVTVPPTGIAAGAV
jgi:hypothetical protein